MKTVLLTCFLCISFLTHADSTSLFPEMLLSNVQEVNVNSVSKSRGLVLYKGMPFTGFLMDVDSNGKVLSQMAYQNGRRNGFSFTHYPDGSLRT